MSSSITHWMIVLKEELDPTLGQLSSEHISANNLLSNISQIFKSNECY